MFHQKCDVGRFELIGLVLKKLRVWEYIGIKGPLNILGFCFIELECTNTKLERIHARATVLKLLIAFLFGVKSVCLIVIADCKS